MEKTNLEIEQTWKNRTLIQAVIRKDTEAVKRALALGADINAVSNSGETALHRAILWSLNDIVKILIEAGADVNARNVYISDTPLMCAGRTGNIENMRMLVKAGADVNLKNNFNNTAVVLLKKLHPEKYSEWVKEIKGQMLEHEDRAVPDDTCGEPDFNI